MVVNMKNPKTLIVRVVRAVLFLLVLAALLLRLDSAFKLIQEDNLCPRYYRYPDDTFDVTFLGASLVLYGIYPMELYRDYGIASYNLSTGNQSLEASYYLAKEAIEKDHPSLIVLDCSLAAKDEEDMEPQYIHYITDTMPYLSENRIRMILELSKPEENRKALLFPLMAYHSRWEELTFEDALPQAKEPLYGAKVTSRTRTAVPFEKAEITPGAMTETSRTYIEKTIDLCRENDTEILLMIMPVPGENQFYKQSGFNLRASAAEEVGQLAKEKGVAFVNYLEQSEQLGLDLEQDVMDGEHVNRWGAEKITKILGAYLKEPYELPNRRGEGGAYEDLDTDQAKYPVNRMRDSQNRSLSLRSYAATLKSDAGEEPVEDALVLATLNGEVDPEYLTEEDAAMLRTFGLQQDLHSWEGKSWLAVIDGGKVVHETSREDFPDEEDGSPGFCDSFEGETGKIRYKVTSGSPDEENGGVTSDASIMVNGMEYATGDRGLHFAVFQKSTGRLMDECWIDIHGHSLGCTHDNH